MKASKTGIKLGESKDSLSIDLGTYPKARTVGKGPRKAFVRTTIAATGIGVSEYRYKGLKGQWIPYMLRFDKQVYPTWTQVAEWVQENMRDRVLAQISNKVWNERIRLTLQAYLKLSEVTIT